ncbi:MAG: hypothetical protein ACREQM_17535 [Candidatus Dormibacteraceae bacterium]
MPAKIAKPAVAGLLILLAGLLCLWARPVAAAAPRLPSLAPVLAAGGLTVVSASRPGDDGDRFQQWTVRERDGRQALLYLEATREPQRVIGWTGQLGYQGDGFQASQVASHPLRLTGGESGTVTSAYLAAPGQLLAMAATDLGPDGYGVGGVSAGPRLLFDEALGQRSLWYLVRVAIPSQALGEPTQAEADQLLATVLPALLAARARQA